MMNIVGYTSLLHVRRWLVAERCETEPKPHAQCSASHIAASPYLVVALLVHCISQPRAFTGKAACSLWCGYRIVYCAIPARDPSLIYVSLFVSGTLSLFQSGVWHIHDHGTPLRCTFTASCICVSCSGSAS